ncbi:tegument protein UL51 [Saimiriine betaherpesvirus 4]|uniref:Tegument protein UL51 homolog n=1 Tax=Saimiriine betaherpesvirus 4 TaxID=1535247 RepID=G8XSX5_9BETA|nr:tegument protein UL51 [Saimiriine betaherpesvirus 4]AEV80921.1 tegument protein UL51 [Saimiriine betaherpesvirus 4]
MECFRRFCQILWCARKVDPRADYVLLKPSEDVELQELQEFLQQHFDQLGVTNGDMSNYARDKSVVEHLLKLMPIYKQCQTKCTFLKSYLSEHCRPHMRPSAEVECRKSQRIMEALDVVILKLIIGEFTMSEDESLEMLLDKFSADQATLCEVQKVMGLVDMDREKSSSMLTTSSEVAEIDLGTVDDAVVSMIKNSPEVPLQPLMEVKVKKKEKTLLAVPGS